MPKRKRPILEDLQPRKRIQYDGDSQRFKIRCGTFDIPEHEGWHIVIKKVFSATSPILKEAVKLLSENLNKGYVKARWGRTEHVAGMYCPKKRMRAAVILVLDDEHVEIHTCATSKYYMRQHLGSILVGLILEWTRVPIVTRASDQPNVIRFWKSMGFEISSDNHKSSAPARANDRTVFMRYAGGRTDVLNTKLPKFKPNKMKRIIVKNKNGYPGFEMYIRDGQVVDAEMKPFPQRPPEYIDHVIRLAMGKTKKQLKRFPELVKKLKPVIFRYNDEKILTYRLVKTKKQNTRKGKNKKNSKQKKNMRGQKKKKKKIKNPKFIHRKYLVTFRGLGKRNLELMAVRKVPFESIFKHDKHLFTWEKVHVNVLNEKTKEVLDMGNVMRRVKVEKPLEKPENLGKGKRGRKKSTTRKNFCPHLSVEELLSRIMQIDPDFEYGVHWCRYCGAKASSGWGRSPWGSKLLCNSHGQKWRAGKLNIIKTFAEVPTEPINPNENTEATFLRFYWKKITATN